MNKLIYTFNCACRLDLDSKREGNSLSLLHTDNENKQKRKNVFLFSFVDFLIRKRAEQTKKRLSVDIIVKGNYRKTTLKKTHFSKTKSFNN